MALKEYEKKAIVARIVPCPKKVEFPELKGLKLTNQSTFALSVPESRHKVVETAVDKLKAYLTGRCGEACFAEDGIAVKLVLEQPREDVPNGHEAYGLTISGDGAVITGYGESGLLYGVVTFCQLWRWSSEDAFLPAIEVFDYPEMSRRGFSFESRYGMNVMEKEDWFDAIDNCVNRKLNSITICLYGCWRIQYAGQPSQELFYPIPDHPELQRPATVRYYSPSEGKWIDYQKLPPIFSQNFFAELVKYGKEHGVTVVPAFNSMGHNSYIPAEIPDLSAKTETGEASQTGYCTNNENLYKFLFKLYDDIIDNCLKPNGVEEFSIGMDEVRAEVGLNAVDPFKVRSPWCKCEKCRNMDRGDLFMNYVVRCTKYLVSRGIKTVGICADMLLGFKSQSDAMEPLKDKLLEVLEREGLKQHVSLSWWCYRVVPEQFRVKDLLPEYNLRNVVTPWVGYYHWLCLTDTVKNISMMAELGHRDHAEALIAYASYDKSYDRAFDATAEYSWGFADAGTNKAFDERYAIRNFGKYAPEAEEAIRLMNLCVEERRADFTNPDSVVINMFNLMTEHMGYYFYSYLQPTKPYPRNFPGEGVTYFLEYRADKERALRSIQCFAEKARQKFLQLADKEGCNRDIALRYAVDCENYLCLAEDWLALLKMHDLTQEGNIQPIAKLARRRVDARLQMMRHCEEVKEKYLLEGLLMRNHSIFLQMFIDIANYVEKTPESALDMEDISAIMSERFYRLR